jgi:hypothetical protein
MYAYRVDPDVVPQEVSLMGRPTALRAVHRTDLEASDAVDLGVAPRSARLDPIPVVAPSGRTMALEPIIDVEAAGLHGTVYLRTGFFDEQTTPAGLDPTGCDAWELDGNPMAFQIAFALPGSIFAEVAPFSCDVAPDDAEAFRRRGCAVPDDGIMQPLMSEAQAVFDRFMEATPDLVRDVEQALSRLRVDILRRHADLLVEAAGVRADQLRERAEMLEAGLQAGPSPRG